jgi:uncharacterized protein YcbX
MRVSGLFVYPLKSARGMSLEVAGIDAGGLRWDRRWMVVDGAGHFVTARGSPSLATVSVGLDDRRAAVVTLTLGVPSASGFAHKVTVNASDDGPRVPVVIWGEHLTGVAPSPEADAALSDLLGVSVRLVAFPADQRRPCDSRYASREDHTAWADGFPVLVTTTASLAALSQSLGLPIAMDRFRPNLVIDNGDDPARAFEEDAWLRLGLGDSGLTLRCVKPCARCVMVNVDPATGKAGREPLRTLTGLRRAAGASSAINFGQNAVLDVGAADALAVGDAVTVLQRR